MVGGCCGKLQRCLCDDTLLGKHPSSPLPYTREKEGREFVRHRLCCGKCVRGEGWGGGMKPKGGRREKERGEVEGEGGEKRFCVREERSIL